jgi:hypothetical protein
MLKPFEEILPALRSEMSLLEELRVRLRKQAMNGWMFIGATLLIGGGVAAACFAQGGTVPGIILAVATLVGMRFIGYFQISKPHTTYVVAFKHQFIRPIAHSVGEGFTYTPMGMIAKSTYMASRLYPRSTDRYNGEDLLEGMIGRTNVRISELHTEYKTTSTDKKGNTKTRWHTIFKGLFIEADFHKHFHGRTFVRPDFAERTMGFIGRAMQKATLGEEALVQLEDKDFEKEFVVRGTDQVEARYILSTSMMRRMIDLKQKFKAEVSFSFVDSSMFIAVALKENLFEPTFGSSVLDEDYLRKYYTQINSCVGIVEDLGLNTRIWGKE